MARGKGARKPPTAKKPPLTHFLCLPLITAASKPPLEASLETFRDEVSWDDRYGNANGDSESNIGSRIHPKAIRPVGALHCTLGVMSLSKERLEQAIETLQSLNVSQLLSTARPQGIDDQKQYVELERDEARLPSLAWPISPPTVSQGPKPLQVDLKGLVSMHDPKKTSILYTVPSDPSQRLHSFCLALQDIFKQNALLVPDDRELKLHATIVNTIYAKGRKKPNPQRVPRRQASPLREDSAAQSSATGAQAGTTENDDRSQGHGPNANAPLKIDARRLLGKYQDFIWVKDVVLDRISICEMGAKKKFDEAGTLVGEEYTEVASVKLPT